MNKRTQYLSPLYVQSPSLPGILIGRLMQYRAGIAKQHSRAGIAKQHSRAGITKQHEVYIAINLYTVLL